MLEQAGRWLAEMREKHLTVPVTYVTRSGKAYKTRATIGKSLFEAPDEHGVIVRTQSRDFLITQYDLAHTPEYGDIIAWDDRLYEVLAPEGKCVWRWSDLFRTTKRIHTKFFKEAEGLYDDTETEEGTTPDKPCCPCRKGACHGKE